MKQNNGRALCAALLAVVAALTAILSLTSLPRSPGAIVHRIEPHRVDVNGADAAELALLPGIGPQLAARIVEERERNGPFRSLEDLERVRGIGPAILAGAADEATTGLNGLSGGALE